MSATPSTGAIDCCNSCGSPVVSQVPGPKGDTGAAGADGTDGVSPVTVLVDDFTVPGAGSFDTARVASTAGFFVGELVAFPGGQFAGANTYFFIQSIGDAHHMDLNNPARFAGVNLSPGATIALGSKLGIGGERGPEGPAGGLVTLNDASPTTTKGDLIVDNGANSPDASDVRLGVSGTNGRVLHEDSSQPTGLHWLPIDLTGVATALSGALPIAKGGTGQVTNTAAFDALGPSSPATGDILRYDGSHWAKFARGTSLQQLRTNIGATDIEWANTTNNVLQMVNTSTNVKSTTATAIPYDDTIPQNTEGTQILSLAITPTNNTSRLLIQACVNVSPDVATAIIAAIFHGSASAIETTATTLGATNLGNIVITHVLTPGSTTPLTISVRVGPDNVNGATVTINGAGGARKFGGSMFSWITITEFA